MNSNTSTLSGPGASPAGAPAGPGGLPVGPQGGLPAGLERLAAAVGEFAADDLDQLGDALLAAQVVALDRLAGQLDAVRLRLLAVVDARGAGGAEQGGCAPSTQAWLRAACRLGAAAAGQRVRTARALHRGPLAATARALADGEVSYAHAAVLADATGDLPPARVAEAEPVLVDAARNVDPARLRRLATHLRDVLDPDGGEERGRAGGHGRAGAAGQADRPRRPALGGAAPRRRLRGAGPPGPPSRKPAPRRGAAATAHGDRGPGQPPRRARRWRGRRLGRGPAARDGQAAGLRRGRHPRHRPPPPHPPRRRGGRRRPSRGPARSRGPAAATPRRPRRAAGPWPRHPRHLARAAPRPRRPRRRLRRPRLRPPAAVDRRPPPGPLAPRRPHQPRQPGPFVPHASPRRPRRRLAPRT